MKIKITKIMNVNRIFEIVKYLPINTLQNKYNLNIENYVNSYIFI